MISIARESDGSRPNLIALAVVSSDEEIALR
jgi:hypothetical protein